MPSVILSQNRQTLLVHPDLAVLSFSVVFLTIYPEIYLELFKLKTIPRSDTSVHSDKQKQTKN
jgi:hypothetical protein